MRAVSAPACRGRRPSSPRGYNIPAAKAPHFFRLGDVEVNAGQNASFQCMAAGRAAEAEHFLLQVRRWDLGQSVLGASSGHWLSPPSRVPPFPRTERGSRISQAHSPSKTARPPFFHHLRTCLWQSRFQQPHGPQ